MSRCGCIPGAAGVVPINKLTSMKSERTDTMFLEAQSFSKRLTAAEKQIMAVRKANRGLMDVTDKTLQASAYPKVYDKNPSTGQVVPVPEAVEEAAVITPGSLRSSPSVELKTEVLDPITSWQTEFQHAKRRMGELSKVRAELDTQRRHYYKDHKKHQKQVRKTDDSTLEAPVEQNYPRLLEARERYNQVETAVYEELSDLVRKTKSVHIYLTKAMQLESKALAQSAKMVEEAEHVAVPAMSPAAAQAPAGGYQTGFTSGEAFAATPATPPQSVANMPMTPPAADRGMAPISTGAGAAGTPVCNQQFFTKVEDRPQLIEKKEYVLEHRPHEKEFVVETRATGNERQLVDGITAESVGVEERVVGVKPPGPPCAGVPTSEIAA